MKRGRPFRNETCPTWLDAMLSKWGRAVHYLLFGDAGWPSRTMLGKIMEEGFTGAAAQNLVHHYPEVLTGEALEVSRAIKRLPSEEMRTVIFAHYVLTRVPVKAKAAKLGIERSTYYDRLKSAHLSLSIRLDGQNSSVCVRDNSDAMVY